MHRSVFWNLRLAILQFLDASGRVQIGQAVPELLTTMSRWGCRLAVICGELASDLLPFWLNTPRGEGCPKSCLRIRRPRVRNLLFLGGS